MRSNGGGDDLGISYAEPDNNDESPDFQNNEDGEMMKVLERPPITDSTYQSPIQPVSLEYQSSLAYRSDNGTRDDEFFLDDEDPKTLNRYYEIVRRLSPSELIRHFMRTANPRVHEAMQSTVLGLLGSLPYNSFETTIFGTGESLANLMLQVSGQGTCVFFHIVTLFYVYKPKPPFLPVTDDWLSVSKCGT